MTTTDFLTALTARPDAPLRFDADGARVEDGYHLTEVKATTVRAMDCGGAATAWNETVLQLWPPFGAEARDPMPAGKFLAIVDRVRAEVDLDPDALVRVEYGPAGGTAVSYLVDAVERDAGSAESGGTTVRLAPPAVACKARDRSVGAIPAARTAASQDTGSVTACCA